MNKTMKGLILRVVLRMSLILVVLAGSFWGYAFVYRGKTEPPTKYNFTSQDPAVYTLGGQMQMLSQKEELVSFAFEDRKDRKSVV